MQPCAIATCDNWSNGHYCGRHTASAASVPTATKRPKPKRRWYGTTRDEAIRLPAVTATRVLASERRYVGRFDRNAQLLKLAYRAEGTVAITDTTVTRADGTSYAIPKNTRKRTSRNDTRTVQRQSKNDHAAILAKLSKLGVVGGNYD
jgi:hypothetical protein